MADQMTLRLVPFKGAGTQPWRFRIVAANGETVSSSEGYATKWNRDRAMKKIGLPIDSRS